MSKYKTPLRYPGGKSRAINKMLPYFPDLSKYNDYREPFIGGGSVAITLTQMYPKLNIWVNDLYVPLYNFWVQLRDRGDDFIEEVRSIKTAHNTPDTAKIIFNDAKESINNPQTSDLQKAVDFYVINKCSFSGLTENSSFSAQSSDRNFTLTGIEKLIEYSKIIKNWKITNLSYEELFTNSSDTFTYLDPPYEIKSHLYGRDRKMHKGFDHDDFANKCNSYTSDMCISYNADDSVKNRFPEWKQIEFDHTYSMCNNSKNYLKDQHSRKELLLLNYNK